MNDNPALTPQEVADILKISKNTVYELIKHNKLNGYRVGNKVRVDLQDVEVYKNVTKTVKTKIQDDEPSVQLIKNPMPYDQSPSQNGFVICGQDIMLDILSNMMSPYSNSVGRILRSFLGSYNGLYALYNDEVQLATTHLWDLETGQYNVPFVKNMLPGIPAVIIHLACRMEGFYVAKGNPKKILSWDDLKRDDIVIVNREKGSGARVLLDQHLRLLNILGSSINGYTRESPTHLAVAAIISRGGADCALGTEKAAMQVNNVDFVPLQMERYELVVKKENMNNPLVELAISIIRSQEFKQELQAIGGYDITETGKIIAET